MTQKKETRARLSIDLDAYPDVRDMLKDAVNATGETTSSITIAAIRKRLPDVIRDLHQERSQATTRFLEKYPVGELSPGVMNDVPNSNPNPAAPAKAGAIAGALAARKVVKVRKPATARPSTPSAPPSPVAPPGSSRPQ